MIHVGDITKLDGTKLEPVDCISFGSPCQDLSVAGKRAGLKHEGKGDDETTRSGLFMEAVRVIKEMRSIEHTDPRTGEPVRYPRYALWENVPGAFSSNKGEDFRVVLEELARIAEADVVIPRPPKGKWGHSGCIAGDGYSLAWRLFDAQYWGVPQRRKRIALVVDFDGGTAPLCFERTGLPGDSDESVPPWKGVARNPEESAGELDSEGTDYTLQIRSGCDGGGEGTSDPGESECDPLDVPDADTFQVDRNRR